MSNKRRPTLTKYLRGIQRPAMADDFIKLEETGNEWTYLKHITPAGRLFFIRHSYKAYAPGIELSIAPGYLFSNGWGHLSQDTTWDETKVVKIGADLSDFIGCLYIWLDRLDTKDHLNDNFYKEVRDHVKMYVENHSKIIHDCLLDLSRSAENELNQIKS